MSTKYFNFNHEQDLTPIEMNDDTGAVTINLGDETQDFDSMQSFAEFYAKARNVKPENLKNWVLIQDGDTYAFTLRTGTAGMDMDKVGQLIDSLKAAGMSPEDIGKAVKSATAEDTPVTNEHNTMNNHDFNDDVKDAVQDVVLNTLDTFDKSLLVYGMNKRFRSLANTHESHFTESMDDYNNNLVINAFTTTSEFKHLYKRIIHDRLNPMIDEPDMDEDGDYLDADGEVIEDYHKPHAYFDMDDAYEDFLDANRDEDDRLMSISLEEVVSTVIHHAIDDVKDSLTKKYTLQDGTVIPSEIALMLELNSDYDSTDEKHHVVDYRDNSDCIKQYDDFKKAVFVNKIAKRDKFLVDKINYGTDGTNTFVHTDTINYFDSSEGFHDLNETQFLFEIKQRFYILTFN